jgi:hypothetical protein
VALFRRFPDADELDLLLAVCRTRGVVELALGDLRVKFADDAPPAPVLLGASDLPQAPELASGRAGGQPTDDELLYGRDAYGIGGTS